MTKTASKTIWQSKTFWAAAITVAIAVLVALLGTDLISDHPEAVLWLIAAREALNVLLRYATDSPVSLTRKPLGKTRYSSLLIALCFLAAPSPVYSQEYG